jgi:hypothetical protein
VAAAVTLAAAVAAISVAAVDAEPDLLKNQIKLSYKEYNP